MKHSLEKLHKFLKLESDRGFDNRAVVGGLDKMLSSWKAEAHADQINEIFINLVLDRLKSYPELSPKSRFETLNGIILRMEQEAGSKLEPLSSENITDEEPAQLTEPEPKLNPPAQKTNQDNVPVSALPKPKITHTTPQLSSEGQPAALNAPVTVLQGIGPGHAKTLARLGLYTLGDLLNYYPRRYVDYSELKPINRLQYNEVVTVIGMVQSTTTRTIRSGKLKMLEAVISDSSGSIRATWFNQPWMANRLRRNTFVSLSGKIEQYLGRLVMNNPELELLDQEHLHTSRIVPIYSLTSNITQRRLRGTMHKVVSFWAPKVEDPVPQTIRENAGLVDLPTAIYQVHFPDSKEQLESARHRLAFDEIFMLQLGVLEQKRTWQERPARKFPVDNQWLEHQISRLPFKLTNAQERSIQDVRNDLNSGHPMNRLLQGDVGSGKTVIAALAVSIMAEHGVQSAIMAPTSILAEQHYNNFINLFSGTEPDNDLVQPEKPILHPDEIKLMIGATPESEKQIIRDGLSNGSIKLIIGTHALIEDPVSFNDLQLAVIDEQHRFGVQQRSMLRSKGENPHLLVMTATPIPRSLALTVYGDLDLSVIDEMPPGRQPVQTQVIHPRQRERAYSLIRRQIDQGSQAFIIYPLVEESEKIETKAAVEEHTRIQKEIFPDLKIGLLHGRLKPDDKERIMTDFRDKEIDILVSTSVIEVGVDIPNATVMLIEGANRFGLAQLHQFRGRVGRGQNQSYCLLLPDSSDDLENARLSAMKETNDGFVLAERDLEQRGPGDFIGTRQSGYEAELTMASLTDVKLIETARKHAEALFDSDPELEKTENQLIASAMARFWGSGLGDIS